MWQARPWRLASAAVLFNLLLIVGVRAPAVGSDPEAQTSDITGLVVDGRHITNQTVIPRDLKAVAGAEVELLDFGLTSVSDVRGQFAFHALPTTKPYKKVQLRVTANGFGRWQLSGAPLRPGSSALELYVQLSAQPQTIAYAPPEEQVARPSNAGTYLDSPCSNYNDNVTPPQSIRVYLVSAGQVNTYDFNFYVKHVLPSEWISSWPAESLRAGAQAVKDYGWFWVNNWRGGSLGTICYDVDSTTNYQVFNPSVSATSTDQAVDYTWNWRVHESGAVFEASYQATITGSTGEGCGAGRNGSVLSQWGSRNCAAAGYNWWQILQTYYYPSLGLQPPTRGVIVLAGGTSGYTLLGTGDVIPFGGAPAVSGAPHWELWDIARGIAWCRTANYGYVLDGYGGVHAVNGAPTPYAWAYWSGWDIARAIVLRNDCSAGYTMDGYGGVHPYNGAPSVTGFAYWSGWDIARGMALTDDVSGYTLDGYGGVHAFGNAPAPYGWAYWSGWDIARAVIVTAYCTCNGYTLDGFGGVHPFNGAQSVTMSGYWPNQDIAKGLGFDPGFNGRIGEVATAFGVIATFR